MAKGQTSKKGSGSAKASKEKKTEGEKRNGEKKVSDDEETAEDDEVEEQEWDLICIIPKTDRSKIDCAGGCTKKACSGWATKENPQDIWYGCKTCAEEEFGGDECWEGDPPSDEEGDAATGGGETPPTTGEESSNTVDKEQQDESLSPDSNEGDEVDGKFSSPNNNKDDPEKQAAEALVAMEEVMSQQQPEESSHAEATTEGRSKYTSKDDDVPVTPGQQHPTLASNNSPSNEEDEEGVAWEIAKIISIDDILNNPIVCVDEGCKEAPMPLPACVIQVPVNNRNKKFYSCLDCYNKTMDWEEEEMPKDQVHLTEEHLRVMAQNCSRKENPALPIFSDSDVSATASANKNKNALTPPPPSQAGKKKNGKPLVTPSPHPMAGTTSNNGSKKEKAKPSANLSAINEKWQQEATKLGGPNAKIVVQIPAAKKIVYDTCFDAFKPQAVTSLHQAMKAIVPGPVLKQCLDDMAGLNEPFELSDDDDDEEETNSKGMAAKNKKASKTSDDPYAGTLRMKAGKLYYFDYSKAKNGGDPDPAESNELAAKLANAQADEAALKDKLQKITAETSKLLGEPTNEEAAKRLSEEEPALKGIVGQVEEARGLKANEERRKATGKAIRVMTGEWRKRKRICHDFIIAAEEWSEGKITMKLCCKGDGPLEIESDEVTLQLTRDGVAKKRQRLMQASKKIAAKRLGTKKVGSSAAVAGNSAGSASDLVADENFIGVSLTPLGTVQREYFEED